MKYKNKETNEVITVITKYESYVIYFKDSLEWVYSVPEHDLNTLFDNYYGDTSTDRHW